MGQIFNKSTHPVTVKKIAVRVWALRDEIESAIERRMRECEAAGAPLYVDDIKEYYGLRTDAALAEAPQLKLVSAQGSEPDEAMLEMMAALAQESAPPQEATRPPAEAPPEAALETAAPPAEGAETTATTATTEESSETIQKADEMLSAQTPNQSAEAKAEARDRAPFIRQAPHLELISYGFALLADVNMEWILTFSKKSFIQGQSVVVEFLIPRPFMMSAEILHCANVSMRSRIISESKPDFRIQCRFTFTRSGERGQLRDFLTSIEPDLPKKANAKDASQETGPEL